MYQQIIKEICQELNIKYTFLSKDWLIKLEYHNKIKYLASNKFDLNGHALGLILDDKYAFYEVLTNLGFNSCIYHILYNFNNHMSYTKDCNTYEYALSLFNKYHQDIVIKPNKGSMGIGVTHITKEEDLLPTITSLLTNNYSISISPYYQIKNEYRVIVLDNEVKLLYKKIKPTVIGDGISTIKELLLKFNYPYFIDKDLSNKVLPKGEEYTYDWCFNLSRGSIASTKIDESTYNKLSNLAKEITLKTGLIFVSIDIIETINNEFLIIEANSGVTMNKSLNFIPNGYNIAKSIYKEALLKMFKNN